MAIEVRPFDGDVSQLRSFLHDTWSEAYRGELYIDFSEEFLAWHLGGPDGAADWALAAYEDGRIEGFLMGKPLRVAMSGEEHRATVAGLLAVRRETRGRNVALVLGRRFVELHRERGTLLTLGFFDGDERSRPLYDTILRSGLFALHEVATVPAEVRIRVLDLPRFLRAHPTQGVERVVLRATQAIPLRRSRAVRELRRQDLPACHALLSATEAQLQHPHLRHVWSPEELEWQLAGSSCTTTLVLGDPADADQVRGFVSFYRVDVVHADRVSAGFIDLLVSRTGDARASSALLRSALAAMKAEGCGVGVLPMRRGRELPSLARSGFVTLPRDLLLCVVGIEGGPPARELVDFRVPFR
jgi:GNAT superfamily N-acetyltransferase